MTGSDRILAVYREPFALTPRVRYLDPCATLAEMRTMMPDLPADFDARGVICINGHPAPRALWGAIRPRPQAVTEVTFHAPPQGGGGGDGNGGKNVLALVAGIGLTILSGGAAAGWFELSSGLFAKGTVSALLLGAGISLAGSLAIAALTAPPSLDLGQDSKRQDRASSSIEGNSLEANGAVPRVIGQRKVFPPFAAEPLYYFDGEDEVVEAICALAGPHRLNDIKVGDTPITSMTGIEYETREGWPGDARLEMIRRQSRSLSVQSEVRGHSVQSEDGRTLDSTTGALSDALPQPLVYATRDAPDEVQLQIAFPQGLAKNASETDKIRVPLRLRLREVGSETWIDLPEIHFRAAQVRQMRTTIKLVWAADPDQIGAGGVSAPQIVPAAASDEGWVEARIGAPGQTATPATDAWAADSYFDAGSGDDYMTAGNLGGTAVQNVVMDRYTALIFLDTATFPKGRYEVEVKRGAAVRSDDYSPAAYTVSGTVWDLFGYQDGSGNQIAQSRSGVTDTVYLLRFVSIWNEHPVPTDDFALIAVRARNRQLSAISTVAGGYVPDWDGTAWRDWVVTSNPAPHYRDIIGGALNADPVPGAAIDEAGLVSWRASCITLGYHCNTVIEDGSVNGAAQITASCGYARPYMSEIWGVVRDYDRSGEAPVQIFTPRNMSGFSWSAAFPRLPDGFRVSYRDETRDYEEHQITVPSTAKGGLLEQVSYDGLTTEAAVIGRGLFDLAQAEARSTFYTGQVPAEGIVCRRGDLVGVWHDMLTAQNGSARIIDLIPNEAGEITAVVLDDAVPLYNEPGMLDVADMLAVTDMLAVGRVSKAAIRRADGSITIEALTAETGMTDVLTFATPLAEGAVAEGNLVVVGPTASEYRRMIVSGVVPRADLVAEMTFVNEAPELWA